MRRMSILILLLAGLLPALAGDAKPAKITVVVRGAVTEECAEAIRQALQKAPGIKVKASDVVVGERGQFGHYFTAPFHIEIADLNKTNIGSVGKAVAQAKTAKRGEVAPSLNLVLYHPALQIQESEVSALREAMAEVNGMAAREVGGTGAVLAEGRFWVRCDDSGVARLEDIVEALRKANLNFKTQKD